MRMTTSDRGAAAAAPSRSAAADGRPSQETALSAPRTRASRLGRVAAVAAVVAGLGAGVATPASAAPDPTPGMTLTIHKPSNFTGSYKTYISGVFPMSQADAQWHAANLGNGGVEYDVFADDPGVGDTLETHWVQRGVSLPGQRPSWYFYAAPDGLRFFSSTMISRYQLNEDSGWFDDTDEIYARAWFIDRNGSYWWGSTSNVVVRNF